MRGPRAPVPRGDCLAFRARFDAEEGKRHRLLRLAVEEDLIEQHDGPGLHARREPLDDRRVLRAAPGGHDLVIVAADGRGR